MAQELLQQSVSQMGADIVIISEPWSPPPQWHNDGYGDASIWIPMLSTGSFDGIKNIYRSKGIVAVKLGDYTVISCYFSPNVTAETYRDRIAELESFLETINTDLCIVAGDFNAKSPMWGSGSLDDHGGVVMEMANSYNLIPIRSQGTHTFERNGHRSLIDILLNGRTMADGITGSRISEEFTASDHRYLVHDYVMTEGSCGTHRNIKKNLNVKGFSALYNRIAKIADPLTIATKEDIDGYIHLIDEIFEHTCQDLHPALTKKKAVWWWNPEIESLRKVAITSRRTLQRTRVRNGSADAIEVL
ncbi:uncharacterized protein LOC143220141 [Lasioglossum baleicum]|uniref:uncharacterized protein LOC143220141 n=1 Tax=Lasioglossum baleicum TaxID=434251 RepID=UPI003FCC4C3B